MPSGPSKQELEMYWRDSRQYFDELARYYKDSDKAYYDEYIAPFYNNSIYSVTGSSGKKGGGMKLLVVLVIFFFLIAGAGAVFFFVISEYSSKDIDPLFKEKKTEAVNKEETATNNKEEPVTKENEKEPGDDSSLSSDDHFIIGSKKIGEKDYDKAEYHLKQVKPGTQYYEQAKQLLENMKYLRKYNK